jgi:hypothetical protein
LAVVDVHNDAKLSSSAFQFSFKVFTKLTVDDKNVAAVFAAIVRCGSSPKKLTKVRIAEIGNSS